MLLAAAVSSAAYGLESPIPAPFAPPTLDLLHKTWRLGDENGKGGMEIADLNGDGQNEIVTTLHYLTYGWSGCWGVISRQPSGEYAADYFGDVFPNRIDCLKLCDFNGDNRPDVCVSTDTAIYVYDGPTKALLATIVASTVVGKFACGDIDGDGQIEFVFNGSNSTMAVYSTAGLERSIPNAAGRAVAIGNILPDRTLEIASSPYGSEALNILSGRTGQVLLSYPQVKAENIYLGDSKGTGEIDAIVAWKTAINGNDLSVFTPLSRTAIWTKNFFYGVGAVGVADLDGDGIGELLVASSQTAGLECFDVRTGLLKWSTDRVMYTTGGIAIGNLDNDGSKELALGASSLFQVFDSATHTAEWVSTFDSRLQFGGSGDIDNDGRIEYVAWSPNQLSSEVGTYYILDSVTREVKYHGFLAPPGSGGHQICKVVVANVDQDPQLEILVATFALGGSGSRLRCFDGLDHSLQYDRSVGWPFEDMIVRDFDLDGVVDVATINSKRLYVYDAATGLPQWSSPPLTDAASFVLLWSEGQLDTDPAREIVIAGNSIHVIDPVTRTSQNTIQNIGPSFLACADYTGDGLDEIVAMSYSGVCKTYNPLTGAVISQIANLGSLPTATAIADVAGDPNPDLIYVASGQLKILYREGATAQTFVGPIVPSDSSPLATANLIGDMNPEIVLEPVGVGLSVYRVNR